MQLLFCEITKVDPNLVWGILIRTIPSEFVRKNPADSRVDKGLRPRWSNIVHASSGFVFGRHTVPTESPKQIIIPKRCKISNLQLLTEEFGDGRDCNQSLRRNRQMRTGRISEYEVIPHFGDQILVIPVQYISDKCSNQLRLPEQNRYILRPSRMIRAFSLI